MKANTYVEVQARGVTQSNELEKPAPHKARTPARKGPTEWLVIIGLLLLSFIPIAGGAHRLTTERQITRLIPETCSGNSIPKQRMFKWRGGRGLKQCGEQ